MTLPELKAVLDTTGYPVSYHHFVSSKTDPAPRPPFITYLSPFSRNFGADNMVHKKINIVQIELYTDKKDLQAETTLENVLDGAELFYDKTETYIEGEKLYQIIYECEVI